MDKDLNAYSDPDRVSAAVRAGNHRGYVGGLWDQIGRRQFEFLRENGLQPGDRVLDVGCGCLRVGIHLAAYLDPGRYFGIDLSQDLLDAGYDAELAALELCHKVPRSHLRAEGGFDASGFDVAFDMLFAQSVFTHLPLNHLKLALTRLAGPAQPGARFFATFFLVRDGGDWSEPQMIPALDRPSYPDRDPFHYTAADIRHCASGLPWTVRIIGDWGHLRGQQMVEFTRTDT